MKKVLAIGFLAGLCASCQLENTKYATLNDMWNDRPQTQTSADVKPAVTPEDLQQGITYDPKTEPETKYGSDMERIRQNVVMKVAGENYVVYEYTDVRVDDIASLASAYCYEYGMGKKAYLRDIYMYYNHKRRATFDCVNLASK